MTDTAAEQETTQYWKERALQLQDELNEFVKGSEEYEKELTAVNDNLLQENAILENKLADAYAQLDETKAAARQSDLALTELQAQAQQFDTERTSLFERIRALESTAETTEEQIRIQRATIDDLTRQVEQAQESFVLTKMELEDEVATMQTENQRLQDELKELQEELEVQKTRQQEAKPSSPERQRTPTTPSDNSTGALSPNGVSELHRWRREKASMQAQIERLKASNAELRRGITRAHSASSPDLASMKARSTGRSQQLKATTSVGSAVSLGAVQMKLAEESETVARLSEEAKLSAEHAAKQDARAKEALEALEHLRERANQLQLEAERANTLNSQLQEMQQRYERVRADKEMLHAALVDAENIATMAADHVSALQQEVAALSAKVEGIDTSTAQAWEGTPAAATTPSQRSEFTRIIPLTPAMTPEQQQHAFLSAASPILPARRIESDMHSVEAAGGVASQEWTAARLLDSFVTTQTKEILDRVRACERGFLVLNSEFTRAQQRGIEAKDELEALIAYACSRSQEMTASLCSCVQGLSEDLANRYKSLLLENQRLLSRLHKSRGKILVYARVRPLLPSEAETGASSVIEVVNETELVFRDQPKQIHRPFVFDRVLSPTVDQAGVFAEVEDLAFAVTEGYNACVFAYGITGSGKTHTMQGTPHHPGLNYRLLEKMFGICKLHEQQHPFKIKVSMMEIYNEELRDLLAVEETGLRKLVMRTDQHGEVHVPNLTVIEVDSPQHIMEVFEQGHSNRAVAATNINEHSSRSHCVLAVECERLQGSRTSIGKMYLVDLAGSERVAKSEAQGHRLREAQHINRSLAALGDVFEALDQQASHIPFRNSKLTHLLQSSFSGDSRVVMFCTMSPVEISADETVFSLQFASRARKIELGEARRVVQVKNAEDTIRHLRSELAAAHNRSRELEKQLKELQRQRADEDTQKKEQLVARRKAAEEQCKAYSFQVAVLQKQTAELKKRIADEKQRTADESSRADASEQTVKRMQQQVASAKREQQSAEARASQFARDTKRLRAQLAELRKSYMSFRRFVPQNILRKASAKGLTGSPSAGDGEDAFDSDSHADTAAMQHPPTPVPKQQQRKAAAAHADKSDRAETAAVDSSPAASVGFSTPQQSTPGATSTPASASSSAKSANKALRRTRTTAGMVPVLRSRLVMHDSALARTSSGSDVRKKPKTATPDSQKPRWR